MGKKISETSSDDLGELIGRAIITTSPVDAFNLLEETTGDFLAVLEHVSRNHPQVITPEYLGDLLDEMDYFEAKFGWPKPAFPGV